MRKILAPERREQLRDIVRQDGVARLGELCRRLNASTATVRRDLEAMEAQGMIRRVHGGAVSIESRLDEPVFDDKAAIAPREKRKIAESAAELVKAGDTIYLDGGSTVLELARMLADRTDITVVTNSLRAAIELAGRGPRLILTGGQFRRLSQTMVGALSRAVLDQLHFDKAFMGTIGLSAAEGLTTTDPDEAFTKHEAAARADELIVLADSAKIGRVSFAKSGPIADIDLLITDGGADAGMLRDLRRRGVKVVRV